MMSIKKIVVSFLCKIGDSMKPLLIKIIPIKRLKKMKSMLISNAYLSSKAIRLPYKQNEFPVGVNLIGYIKAQMGLGQGCRLIAQALELTKIPFIIIDTRVGNPFNHSNTDWEHCLSGKPIYSINIFHVNPEQMLPLQLALPKNTADKRYNIGIWLWELSEFPNEWLDAFSYVDEVWTPSNFCVNSISKKSTVPVTLIPYGISVKADIEFDRNYFGLDDNAFLFLIMFDTNSTIQRKNPISAIKAFKEAFSKLDNSVGLVIKINNPTPQALEQINREMDGYKNYVILKKTLSKEEVSSLISICDTFVSLHRSEGFGLVIAEAMLLKTPVIATNYSANTDFMNAQNSCCVDYKLVRLEEDYNMYKSNQYWAEPNISQASNYMKILRSNEVLKKELTENAYLTIKNQYSIEASAEAIKKRLHELGLTEN